MKYHQIDRNLFIKNRKKFVAQMAPHSLAVFNSNDIYPVSADSTLPFAQHRDIFYLSGVDQEESILVLFPDAFEEKHREVLFLRETNEDRKSTRLNSSHVRISYAVFCLKKKTI